MSRFPGTPKSMRGAIFSLKPPNIIPTLVVFQYNPHEVRRSITAAGGQSNARGGAGWAHQEEPDEKVSFSADLNAADQPPGSIGLPVGLHPQLAALENLIYSPPLPGLSLAGAGLGGTVDILSGTTQLTLLIWGPARVAPVELTSLVVTEQDFDEWLNPIRATIQFELKVLAARDLAAGHPAAEIQKTYHVLRQVSAAASSFSALGSFIKELPVIP